MGFPHDQPRRLRPRALPSAVTFVLVLFLAPSAEAQWEAGGAVTGHLLIPGDSDWGGLLMVDLAVIEGPSLGLAIGGGAISSSQDDRSRAFMPLALSLAHGVSFGDAAVFGRARGGAWAGATNAGLALGWFASIGVHGGWSLGGRAWATIGVDGIGVGAHGTRLAVAPGLGFAWMGL
jgi:hypothetical protein